MIDVTKLVLRDHDRVGRNFSSFSNYFFELSGDLSATSQGHGPFLVIDF